jgi:NADH-quinone oxidoreductase subunit D
LFKPGGVRRDVDEETFPWIFERLDRCAPVLDLLDCLLSDDPIFKARTQGVGVLSEDAVRTYGVVGPAARASGVAVDVRKDDPYFAYPWVDWNLALRSGGDIHAKAEVRLFEMRESLDIIRQCLTRMKPGPVEADVKGLPAGIGIGRVEAPRGELFHFLVADGAHKPVRYQIRAPSYVNVFSLEEVLIGEDIDDAALVLAAMDPCTACTERLTAVLRNDPERPVLSGLELIRRSLAKTEGLRTASVMKESAGNPQC